MFLNEGTKIARVNGFVVKIPGKFSFQSNSGQQFYILMINPDFVSIPNPEELIKNRIKFKFYCTEKHLSNVIRFQQNENINSSFESRVRWEAEIECLLSQLIGSKDALLMTINEKLKLGIPKKDVNLDTVNQRLNFINRGSLLYDLNRVACSKGSWFWILNDLRNQGMHRSVIKNKHSRKYN
jgi:hypothetical protein